MESVAGKRRSDICQPCQRENTPSKADGYCGECKEFMCGTCFQHHLKARCCRTHVLLDSAEIDLTTTAVKDVEKCEKHENETIRFYCRRHDTLGCGDCMLFDGHSSCPLEYIKDVAVNFRQTEDFKHSIEKLETLKSDNKANVGQLEKNLEENNKLNNTLLDDVGTFRNSIKNHLDKIEADSISFANKLHSENNDLFTELQAGCHDIDSEIEEHKQKLSCERYTDRTLFIHSVIIKPKLQQVDDAIKRTEGMNKFSYYTFKPNQELTEIISKCERLGSFEKVSETEISNSTGEPISTHGRTGERAPDKSDNSQDKTTIKKVNESDAHGVKHEKSCQDEHEHTDTSKVYRIFVKEDTGKIHEYLVEPSETISAVKQKMNDKQGIPVERIVLKLPLTGKVLQDKFLISDYYIHNESTLSCSMRLRAKEESGSAWYVK